MYTSERLSLIVTICALLVMLGAILFAGLYFLPGR